MTAMTTIEVRGPDGRPQAVAPRLRLRVSDGPDAGAVFVATRDRIVVGTAGDADLALHDKTVSRYHCELVVVGDRVEVRDLGSRNGTSVDGVGVVHAFLRPGASLAVGASKLVLEVDADGELRIPLADGDGFGGLVGRSLAMRAVFARLERVAASDATVLLTGETGTGKEGAAEAVHAAGARRGGPFVVVDCGAIPPELIESELFGHDKGAFTGASTARAGAFVSAHGGTVILDELGELPPALQPKLLRALERREVKPVGHDAYVPIDVRLIAATHRDLRAEVNAHRFRADLYYRLAVVEVRLPPLRERREDLPLLVEHLLRALGVADRPEAAPLRAPAFLAEIAGHPWPGNVRELRNHVERCLVLRELSGPGSSGEAAPPDAAPADVVTAAAGSPGAIDLRQARGDWERRYLEDLLAQHGNNVSATARAAGIDRKYLYRLLWRNGLR